MLNEVWTLRGTHRHEGNVETLHTFASKEDAMLWDNDPVLNRASVYIVGWYWKDVTLVCHVSDPFEESEVIEDYFDF